jgi:copper oxidase (laccase) domain-containing protein
MVPAVTEAFLFLNPISTLPGFHPHWIPRLPDVDVLGDRDFALRNLAPHHGAIIAAEYPEATARHHAEQVHGNQVSLLSPAPAGELIMHPGVDGMITNIPDQLLAIYVADCAAIYLVDPIARAIALLHSGKKGTEGNILGIAVSTMISEFGTNPANLVCVLSPCIRPPHYEVDIASMISQQAASLGIEKFHDSCQNTAQDLSIHYSYRMEKGQTGRMLALLAIH